MAIRYRLFLWATAALALTRATNGQTNESCKASPGSPRWPSVDAWHALNDTLGGQLLVPTPSAAACHPEQPSYDPEKCIDLTEDWQEYAFHSEDPVSVMWNQYANDTCLPDAAYSCSASGYPSYVVNATNAEHVKLGIDFARRHDIRVVVKNTGHDYLGRSVAPSALSIWTHNLQGMQHHTCGFRLEGSNKTITGTAVTVGAGAMMGDIFAEVDKYNETIVGGTGATVGIAGYITGAGHSPLAPRHGLGADNVLEMEVVTPAGEIVTANEHTNIELFWALRGGGGSTFGIITSLTLKTHPTPKIVGMQYIFMMDADHSGLYDVSAYILSQLPSLGDHGLSGYAYTMPRMQNPLAIGNASEEVAAVMGLVAIQDSNDPEDMLKLWRPINDTVNSRWPGVVEFIPLVTAYPSYYEWIRNYFDNRPAGFNSYMASWLLDEHALTNNLTALAGAAESAASPSGQLQAFLVSGRGVHEQSNNAVNPGWRSSYVLALTTIEFPPHNAIAKQEAIDRIIDSMGPFRQLAPHTGVYLNEATPYEPNWQKAFWGDNYERLVRIKREVDPDDVLWCPVCVGSEGWEERDGIVCRV